MRGMHWASAGCLVNVARMVPIVVTLPRAERVVTQPLPLGQMMAWRGESAWQMTGAAVGPPSYSRSAVPPVGVEPTLGTLLGGRPLPLGYGGGAMIPRTHVTILDNAIRNRLVFMRPAWWHSNRCDSSQLILAVTNSPFLLP
jgi:hypothetical protein